MKRSVCLILVLSLLLVLTACGGSEDQGGSVTPASTEAELSMGRMEGGTYSNAYAGYAIDLDTTWTYYSAEELQQMPAAVADAVSGSEMGEALANVNQFTDMMVESVEAAATINVLYQKLDMSTRLAFMALSDEQILDESLKQKDMMIDAYAQAGMEVSSMEKTTTTFLGEETAALKTLYTIQGVDAYCLQVFDYHLGEYSVTTTFTSFGQDNTDALAAMFYAYEG